MATEPKNPRLVQRGDVLEVDVNGTTVQDVVRSVDVIVNMANGQTAVFHTGDRAQLVTDPDPDVAEIVAAVTEEDVPS